MKNIIIYNDKNLRVVHCHSAIKEDVVQEADKVVPHAIPYKIIDSSEIPADRTFRNAWEVDDSGINDGVGGELKAKADLSQAENILSEQNGRLAIKQTDTNKAKEDWDKKEGELEEIKKGGDEQAIKDAQKAADDAKAVYEELYDFLEKFKLLIPDAEEKVAAAKKLVQECLDALPLDKRST